MNVKLLAIGDLHLGRRPTRLDPQQLEEHNIKPGALTPSAGWRLCVDEAIKHNVNAVLLAGDLVESMSDRFESLGHLQKGAQALMDSEIPLIAVAGNHDAEALPRLATLTRNLTILGQGGDWQTFDVPGTAFPIQVLGTSFVQQNAHKNPLRHYPTPTDTAVTRVGLLHADLNARETPYAPVTKRGLRQAGLDAWLLGHIHTPGNLTAQDPIGYLGSVTGLDPTETGAHGPWLVEVSAPHQISFTQIPLSPIRWGSAEIDMTGISFDETDTGEQQTLERIHHALRTSLETLPAPKPAILSLRLKLTGTVHKHDRMTADLLTKLRTVTDTSDGCLATVERLEDAAREPLDLESLAQGQTPPGILAKAILALEQGEDPDLAKAVKRAVNAHRRNTRISTNADEALQRLIQGEATQLLEQLMIQNEEERP